jgi:hypothetical protein
MPGGFDMAIVGEQLVRVEVDAETLNRLLAAGQVCAADFRCLDCESKRCIWRLCLISCAIKLKTSKATGSVHESLCQSCGQCLKGNAMGSGRWFPASANGHGGCVKD